MQRRPAEGKGPGGFVRPSEEGIVVTGDFESLIDAPHSGLTLVPAWLQTEARYLVS
jgi:hypothetical protein